MELRARGWWPRKGLEEEEEEEGGEAVGEGRGEREEGGRIRKD